MKAEEGNSFRMVRMASTPPMTGMRRSINVMSGRCSRNICTASSPFAACPATDMPGSLLMIAARPRQTTGWSSAIRTRIVSVRITFEILYQMRHVTLWLGLVCGTAFGAVPAWVGSRACAECHASIFQRYTRTPMALSSGAAGDNDAVEQFGRGSFAGSGYVYGVARRGDKYVLGVRKQDGSQPPFERKLSYFVGSGSAARSFLMDLDGFLYEAPVTYYASSYTSSDRWNFSPGYRAYSYPFLTRAIAPACLACHSTGVRPVPRTQNGYESPPFLEAGIGCERCHGPGGAHVQSRKAADIVNPARLEPQRRDSVCNQCHLSGEVRVDRAGMASRNFVAGEKLDNYAVAFTRASTTRRMKVTSHAENLAQSACKRASGDRMWCGTCHDPHGSPAASERVAWFRSKCLTCHAIQDCKGTSAARAAKKDDCAACHMPRTNVSDAEHVVY